MKLINDIEQRLGENAGDGGADGDDELRAKLHEIKMQKHMLKANQQKINGIEPHNFDEHDIRCGIEDQDDGHMQVEKQDANKSWTDMIIMRKEGYCYVIHNFCFVLCCLVSSYIYVWFAAFGSP